MFMYLITTIIYYIFVNKFYLCGVYIYIYISKWDLSFLLKNLFKFLIFTVTILHRLVREESKCQGAKSRE